MKWSSILACLLMPAFAAAHPASRSAPACATCHLEARSQPATSMGLALETVEECEVLSSHSLLRFKNGSYSYRIERKGNQSVYSVTNGDQTLTMPIRWAMGASSAIGQTYILEKDGQLYESRVSYFRELNGLDLTMGAQESAPNNMTDAAGRLMGLDDKLRCFGCHATDAAEARQLTLDKLTPGVQCEHCHGSAKKHLAGMAEGASNQVKMSSLTTMSAEQVSNFCGKCHRTWEEIVLIGRLDITDLRFQPYRLAGSKCFDTDDRRISCVACHNPHQEVDSHSSDYDSKCQACHSGGKHRAVACKVATKNCATCHMPKIELPGAHYKFTDHRIRIVKANEAFPG